MPSLQIRDLPEPVYRQLRQAADREHRTLSQQATVLLAQALEARPGAAVRRRMLIERLSQQPLVRDLEGLVPPERLVREDRKR
jgi:plasmid stability protein